MKLEPFSYKGILCTPIKTPSGFRITGSEIRNITFVELAYKKKKWQAENPGLELKELPGEWANKTYRFSSEGNEYNIVMDDVIHQIDQHRLNHPI